MNRNPFALSVTALCARPVLACLLGLFLMLGPRPARAQSDPVLMRINGREVMRSDYVQAVGGWEALDGMDKASRERTLRDFIDFRLRVEVAEQAGLDTVASFGIAISRHREQAFLQLFAEYGAGGDSAHTPSSTHHPSDEGNDKPDDLRLVAQIFRPLSQHISASDLEVERQRMDSIYIALQRGVTFEECVRLFSHEKEASWIGRLDETEEFERVAFSLKEGEWSEPFFSPRGLHIIKVLAMQSGRPDAARAGTTTPSDALTISPAMLEDVRRSCAYTPNRPAMDELLAQGSTRQVLFSLDGKPYDGALFDLYARAHPSGRERQLEGFICKSVLDCAARRAMHDSPAFRHGLQAYRDSLLEREGKRFFILSQLNESRLEAYFESHRADYHYASPHYQGMVIHAKTKKVARQARKFLKSLPQEEWAQAVRMVFGDSGNSEVLVEHGLYALGDNAFVDELVFRQDKAKPMDSHPYAVVLGEKVKGPEHYEEVRSRLVDDCSRDLQQRWMDGLRAVAKVEINQEVLKTVNNRQ